MGLSFRSAGALACLLAAAAPVTVGCGGSAAEVSPGRAPVAGAASPGPVVLCEARAPAAGDASPRRWWHDAIGYEIFVRSYQDSGGDGVGDLRGLMARLDYLNDGDRATDIDLGVDLVWLMPITESPSYHGYDVTDYRTVDLEYGTEADLTALLGEAKARGIRVVMDLVVNHSSREHPWFVESAASLTNPRRDWYVWSDEPREWNRPWGAGPTWHAAPAGGPGHYYALFWEGMPDLNFANPAVAGEMTAIAQHWLGLGLDGFRLDAARYLVETGEGAGQSDTAETHAYWQTLRRVTDASHPDALLLGEIWESNAIVGPYLAQGQGGGATAAGQAPELHMAFDFESSSGLRGMATTGEASRATEALCRRVAALPTGGAMGTFLANHDMRRVGTTVDVGSPEESAAAVRMAMATLFTWPGTPWLYYGEELGLPNGPSMADEDKRLPMPWTADTPAVGFTAGTPWRAPVLADAAMGGASVEAQAANPESLLAWTKRLIRLRRARPALSRGDTIVLGASGSKGEAMALYRVERTEHGAGDRALVVVNPHDEPQDVAVPPAPAGWPALRAMPDVLEDLDTRARRSMDAVGAPDGRGGLVFRAMPARSVKVLAPLLVPNGQ